MDPVASYVMIALLGAGAAYGLMNKGKPKPKLSTTKRNMAIACFGFAILCGLLAVAVNLMAGHPSQ